MGIIGEMEMIELSRRTSFIIVFTVGIIIYLLLQLGSQDWLLSLILRWWASG